MVRRYDLSEPGAARVEALCVATNEHTVFIARHGSVEVASALGRKSREGKLHADELRRLWQLFQVHWRYHYGVVELNQEIYERAELLVLTHSLRAFDAVHVATALPTVSKLGIADAVFCTADRRQSIAARREGLNVELIT